MLRKCGPDELRVTAACKYRTEKCRDEERMKTKCTSAASERSRTPRKRPNNCRATARALCTDCCCCLQAKRTNALSISIYREKVSRAKRPPAASTSYVSACVTCSPQHSATQPLLPMSHVTMHTCEVNVLTTGPYIWRTNRADLLKL